MFDKMKNNLPRLALMTALSVGIVGFAIAPSASAWDRNQMTIVTFNAPVEVPGTVLPAGTYVFKLVPNEGSENVVQIMDKDQSRVFATVLTAPSHRDHATGKTVIEFNERPAGLPEAIGTWYYPGREDGHAFVYNTATKPVEAE